MLMLWHTIWVLCAWGLFWSKKVQFEANFLNFMLINFLVCDRYKWKQRNFDFVFSVHENMKKGPKLLSVLYFNYHVFKNKSARLTILRKFSTLLALIRVLLA